MDDLSKRWRAHTGALAWPTLALHVVALAGWVGVIVAHATGQLGHGAALLANSLFAYLTFTPLHEASHGNVGGSRDRAWVDTLVGWLAALPLLSPFPAFKVIHLRHHGATNDPDRDPDFHVAGTGPKVLLASAWTMVHYELVFWRTLAHETPSGRAFRPWAGVFYAGLVVALVGPWWLGFGATVLWAVALPAAVAATLLGLAFDWLPHHPHTVQGRFRDTRALPSRTLEVLLLGQNLHLVHHLWPRVPWYRYGAVFAETRPLLEAEGAPIGWGAELVPRAPS